MSLLRACAPPIRGAALRDTAMLSALSRGLLPLPVPVPLLNNAFHLFVLFSGWQGHFGAGRMGKSFLLSPGRGGGAIPAAGLSRWAGVGSPCGFLCVTLQAATFLA